MFRSLLIHVISLPVKVELFMHGERLQLASEGGIDEVAGNAHVLKAAHAPSRLTGRLRKARSPYACILPSTIDWARLL